jgi:hypothetical protein
VEETQQYTSKFEVYSNHFGHFGDGLFLGFPHYSLILLISVHFANVLPQITILKGR